MTLPIEDCLELGDERLAFLTTYVSSLDYYVEYDFEGPLLEAFTTGLVKQYPELLELLVSNRILLNNQYS